MQCADLADRLTDLMEGDLPADEEAAALDHLATCPSCERVLAQTRDVEQMVRDHGGVGLSADDRARMLLSVIEGVEGSVGG